MFRHCSSKKIKYLYRHFVIFFESLSMLTESGVVLNCVDFVFRKCTQFEVRVGGTVSDQRYVVVATQSYSWLQRKGQRTNLHSLQTLLTAGLINLIHDPRLALHYYPSIRPKATKKPSKVVDNAQVEYGNTCYKLSFLERAASHLNIYHLLSGKP